jgi:2-polyprenyl-3-methyl-5-hydroxy-6-metoxy-1,4-benzoquinol methylase
LIYKQYGKTSSSLIAQKLSFFEDNASHIEKNKKIADVYIQQPIRIYCKNCGEYLNSNADFIKDNIEYKICKICTHLNGSYEDTNEFCNVVYAEEEGEKDYAQNYLVESVDKFNYRVSSIYIPKAEFLYSSLANDSSDPNKLTYLDFGAGVGYFVDALRKIGIRNVSGTEVSKYQVEFGNKMIGENLLYNHSIIDTNKFLSKTNANVVSLIGVLEHLQDPRSALKSISSNKNIKYIYISVPLFSLSVFLEMISPNVYHRQLHGGHTHLYTEKSIQHLADEYKFNTVSEWWFGTDMVDLYRHINVQIGDSQSSDNLLNVFKNMMMPAIDAMQLEMDKKHISSEVHILFRSK